MNGPQDALSRSDRRMLGKVALRILDILRRLDDSTEVYLSTSFVSTTGVYEWYYTIGSIVTLLVSYPRHPSSGP